MSAFSSMQIGRTGMGFAHHWLDKVGHNLANSNTVTNPDDEPFRALHSIAAPLENGPFTEGGSGVTTAAQWREEGEPDLTYDPEHPLANEDGLVAQPVMDTSAQMVDMMIAQRHYQLNSQTVKSAKEAYEHALRLGR